MNRIVLYPERFEGSEFWMARFEGPHATEIAGLFGTTELPTPCTTEMPFGEVLRVVAAGWPGIPVELASIQESLQSALRDKGRTMRQAQDAGTLYEITHPEYAMHGRMYPAAETPREAMACLNWRWADHWPWYPPGTTFAVNRVIDATIGATYIDATAPQFFRFERGEMTEVTRN